MKKVNIICKIIIALMLLFCLSYTILFLCAKYGSKIDIENSNSIYMYDKDKKSFYEGNNGTKKWVKLKDISKDLVNATIYSEDKNFYRHNGFDIPRIVKSMFINSKAPIGLTHIVTFISYLAFAYVDDSVKTISLNGYEPTAENVTTNNWPLWSYEHMYTKGEPTGLTKEFLDYVMSDEVQKGIVEQMGYISVNDMQVTKSADGTVTEK